MTELPRTSATPFGVSKRYRRYVLGILLPAIKLDLDLSDTQIGFVTGGEVIGFSKVSGNAFVGGMSLMPALTFGRLLGQEIPNW